MIKFTNKNLVEITGISPKSWYRWERSNNGRTMIYRFLRDNFAEFSLFCDRQKILDKKILEAKKASLINNRG